MTTFEESLHVRGRMEESFRSVGACKLVRTDAPWAIYTRFGLMSMNIGNTKFSLRFLEREPNEAEREALGFPARPDFGTFDFPIETENGGRRTIEQLDRLFDCLLTNERADEMSRVMRLGERGLTTWFIALLVTVYSEHAMPPALLMHPAEFRSSAMLPTLAGLFMQFEQWLPTLHHKPAAVRQVATILAAAALANGGSLFLPNPGNA